MNVDSQGAPVTAVRTGSACQLARRTSTTSPEASAGSTVVSWRPAL